MSKELRAKGKQEIDKIRSDAFHKLTGALKAGLISPKDAQKSARDLGYRVKVVTGGKRDNSKYTNEQLREMRRNKGIGRPRKGVDNLASDRKDYPVETLTEKGNTYMSDLLQQMKAEAHKLVDECKGDLSALKDWLDSLIDHHPATNAAKVEILPSNIHVESPVDLPAAAPLEAAGEVKATEGSDTAQVAGTHE